MRQSESTHFKANDAHSYDPVAVAFARFTDRFSAPLADRLIALACLRPSDRVLDVGTGTAVVALRVVDSVQPQGTVVGIDLSAGMLEVARAQAVRQAAAAPLHFCRMDAEQLALRTESFDAVLSLFALLHLPNALAALEEMHRVLRPGGRLVVAVGSGPPWLSVAGLLHRIARLPDAARAVLGKDLVAPQFLDRFIERALPSARSSDALPAHGHPSRVVPALIRAAGFQGVRTSWQGHVGVVESAESFWELQATFSSVARKRLAATRSEDVERMRADFLRRCRTVQEHGGRLLFPHAALFVTARRAT